MRSRSLTFPGPDGATLSARLDFPPGGEPVACALFAHCFTCAHDLRAAIDVSRALTGEGIAVLRFDFTGPEDGADGDPTVAYGVDDLVAAAEVLAAEGLRPDVLVGHSLGGAAVVRAASRIPAARAVVTIATPFGPWGDDTGETEVPLAPGGRPARVRRELLDDLRAARLGDDLRELRRPLLVFHSPADRMVPIEHAARIFTAARHPKSYVSLDDADHLLTSERDSRYVGRVLAAWVSRYLPEPVPPTVRELVEREDVVTVTERSGFRTAARAGGHGFVVDEPEAVGGTDAGPTPYDLILAALGACTGMTLRMYAARKGWPLEEVEVHLRHGRLHAMDEERCAAGGEARMDRMERTVALTGALTDEQRARLLEMAERCPVHRTLAAGVRVETVAAIQKDFPTNG